MDIPTAMDKPTALDPDDSSLYDPLDAVNIDHRFKGCISRHSRWTMGRLPDNLQRNNRPCAGTLSKSHHTYMYVLCTIKDDTGNLISSK